MITKYDAKASTHVNHAPLSTKDPLQIVVDESRVSKQSTEELTAVQESSHKPNLNSYVQANKANQMDSGKKSRLEETTRERAEEPGQVAPQVEQKKSGGKRSRWDSPT